MNCQYQTDYVPVLLIICRQQQFDSYILWYSVCTIHLLFSNVNCILFWLIFFLRNSNGHELIYDGLLRTFVGWSLFVLSWWVHHRNLKVLMITSAMASFSQVIVAHTFTHRLCFPGCWALYEKVFFVHHVLHNIWVCSHSLHIHVNKQHGSYTMLLYLITSIDTIHCPSLPATLSLQYHIITLLTATIHLLYIHRQTWLYPGQL